jgi:hypothetical protein
MLFSLLLIPYALLYGLAMLTRGWLSLALFTLAGVAVVGWNYTANQGAVTEADDTQFLVTQGIIWMSTLGLLAGVSIKAILLQRPEMRLQTRRTIMMCGLFLPVLIGGGITLLMQ